jgi:hypothetical protein
MASGGFNLSGFRSISTYPDFFRFKNSGSSRSEITYSLSSNYGSNKNLIKFVWGTYDTLDQDDSGNSIPHKSTPTLITTLTPPSGAANDYYGAAVATGHQRILIGSYGDDDDGSTSGSVFLYSIDGTYIKRIAPSNAAASKYFGKSVDIGCGKIVIGAPSSTFTTGSYGSAYIYDIDGNIASETILSPTSGVADKEAYGESVSIGCGVVVLGASRYNDATYTARGRAFIFDLDGNQIAELSPPSGTESTNMYFGQSVAVGNGKILVGAPGAYNPPSSSTTNATGKVFVYDLKGNHIRTLVASDAKQNYFFGTSVSIGSGKIVVGSAESDKGAFNAGATYIYDYDCANEIRLSGSISSMKIGTAVSVKEGRIVSGAKSTNSTLKEGEIRVYDLEGQQVDRIFPETDGVANTNFGSAVDISDGIMVVGAYGFDSNTGKAYIYSIDTMYTAFDAIDIYNYN